MKPVIKLIRTSQGETIISKVVELREDETLVLEKPMALHGQPTQSGGMQIGFIPYAPFLDDKELVPIMRKDYVYACLPEKEMIDNYKKAIGEQTIVTPPQGLILPS